LINPPAPPGSGSAEYNCRSVKDLDIKPWNGFVEDPGLIGNISMPAQWLLSASRSRSATMVDNRLMEKVMGPVIRIRMQPFSGKEEILEIFQIILLQVIP